MKTMLVVEVTHSKPLPTKVPLTDILTDRVYNYLFAQGHQVGVKVVLAGEVEEQAHG